MNYNTLRNKPTINYREIIGDSTVSEVGGMTEEEFDQLLDTDLASYYTKAEVDDLFSRSYVFREKSGSIVTFDCPSTSQSIPEVTVDIEAVQSGSGDPSPTNVRPITGWSAVNVTRCGKNLIGKGTLLNGFVNTVTMQFNEDSSSVGYYFNTNDLPDEITFNAVNGNRAYYGYFNVIPRDGAACLDVNQSQQTLPKTITVNKTYKYIHLQFSYNQSITNVQIENGSTATAYEPYNGQTYTTVLKDENDQPLTCYGGQLENVNGVLTLTVTHANIASYNGETINKPWISSMDVYSEGATPTTGAQVVYPLTTPTEIPQQNLAISTQDGTNNLWADSGDIEVKCLDRIIPAGE